jgi:hypothetical protein
MAMRRRYGLAVFVSIACAAAVLASPARAESEFVVYHSAAGDGSGLRTAAFLAAGAPHTLHLYMAERNAGSQSSSSPSEVCSSVAATGTERCGWDVVVELEGDGGVETLEFTSFVAAPGVVGGPAAGASVSKRFRANGGDHLLGDTSPTWIGDLTVVPLGSGIGEVWIRSESSAVRANLNRVGLDEEVIVFLPEPSIPLGMLAGSLLLSRLPRRRARSRVE